MTGCAVFLTVLGIYWLGEHNIANGLMPSLLFLIPSLHARGAERALVNLVNSLDKSRFSVTVQTLFDVGPLRQSLAPDIIYRPGLPWLVRGNVAFLKLFSPAFLYRAIVGQRYDVVVAFLEGTVTRIISGCPYSDTRKIAWVHTELHDSAAFAYCYRHEEEAVQSYRAFDQVVAVSRSVKQYFDMLSGCSAQVIYNLIEVDRIRQSAKEPVTDLALSELPNLVSIGSLIGVKGYDRLIRVHQRLIESGLSHHIYVIGEGSEEAALRRQIIQLGLADTFHLLGYRSNPYKYLTHADLFVCSSRQEGMSTAVSEALVLGVPVVSTLCSGAEELLGKNGEYGMITSNDEQGIYSGLSSILSDPILLQELRQKASMRCDSFSSTSKMASLTALFDQK